MRITVPDGKATLVGSRQTVTACGDAVVTEAAGGSEIRLAVRGPVDAPAVEAVASRVLDALAEGFTVISVRWLGPVADGGASEARSAGAGPGRGHHRPFGRDSGRSGLDDRPGGAPASPRNEMDLAP